jgi:hypothetical protein
MRIGVLGAGRIGRTHGGRLANPCTARDSLEGMRIAVAAGRSRVEHHPVRLTDV